MSKKCVLFALFSTIIFVSLRIPIVVKKIIILFASVSLSLSQLRGQGLPYDPPPPSRSDFRLPFNIPKRSNFKAPYAKLKIYKEFHFDSKGNSSPIIYKYYDKQGVLIKTLSFLSTAGITTTTMATTVLKYNKTGDVSNMIFDQNGIKTERKFTYEYNNDNILVVHYSQRNRTTGKTDFIFCKNTYDSLNRLLSSFVFAYDSLNYYCKSIYTYNKTGYTMEYTLKKDSPEEKVIFTYNDKDLCTETLVSSKFPIVYSTYQYGKYNNISQEDSRYNEYNTTITFEYKYDAEGRILEVVSKEQESGGTSIYIKKKYEYKFY